MKRTGAYFTDDIGGFNNANKCLIRAGCYGDFDAAKLLIDHGVLAHS